MKVAELHRLDTTMANWHVFWTIRDVWFWEGDNVADNGRVHVASGYQDSWTLSDKLKHVLHALIVFLYALIYLSDAHTPVIYATI